MIRKHTLVHRLAVVAGVASFSAVAGSYYWIGRANLPVALALGIGWLCGCIVGSRYRRCLPLVSPPGWRFASSWGGAIIGGVLTAVVSSKAVSGYCSLSTQILALGIGSQVAYVVMKCRCVQLGCCLARRSTLLASPLKYSQLSLAEFEILLTVAVLVVTFATLNFSDPVRAAQVCFFCHGMVRLYAGYLRHAYFGVYAILHQAGASVAALGGLLALER